MFLQLIQKRRSIRKFTDQTIEKEKIDILIEALLRSPSSRSFNPWEYIVITDRALLEKLSQSKPHGASFLKNAPLGIVICADSERSDVWVEDTSIAATYLQLAAESIGLGSCWIQIRKRYNDKDKTKSAGEYISELLDIPEKMKVECIVALGYPNEIKKPHAKENLQYEKVYLNSYGNKL